MSHRSGAKDEDIAQDDLIAYADGEAAGAVAARIGTAPALRDAAARYRRDDRRITQVLYRRDCPPAHDLGEYALGMLAAGAERGIAAHLSRCPRCTAEVRTLRDFLAAPGASPALAPSGGAGAALRRVVAALLPPSGALALGQRGADDATTRTYRAEQFTLTLDAGVAERAGRAMLTGLVLAEGDGAADAPTGGAASLVAADGAARETDVDDLGNFTFDDIAPGAYALTVTVGGTQIVVAEFPIAV